MKVGTIAYFHIIFSIQNLMTEHIKNKMFLILQAAFCYKFVKQILVYFFIICTIRIRVENKSKS